MMTILSAEAFASKELPRVFWSITVALTNPYDACELGAVVKLPNGLNARCEEVVYQGSDARGHNYMGFVSEIFR